MKLDEGLKAYANEWEAQCIDAINEFGSERKAAAHLGRAKTCIHRAIVKAKKKASRQGYAPENDLTHPVPSTHFAKGISTLYNQQGEVQLQWVKSQNYVDDMRETAEQIVESLSIEPCKPVPPPEHCNDDFLTVYPLGDPHIGMLALAEEAGENFDCKIAERNLCGGIDSLILNAWATDKALIVNLGDFFHADNQSGTTARSGNRLDVDTRKQKVMVTGVRIMYYLIDAVLKKHNHVTIINEVGNHDDESSFVLSLILEAKYCDDERVKIDMSPATFHYYRFHSNLIGVTHGYQCKPDKLGQIMAADKPQDWGDTEYRYWLVGHVHHISRKEVPGCVIESFRTLAAKDAWHSASGYRSGRDMVRIDYHKHFGEKRRETCGIKEIASFQLSKLTDGGKN
jgi:hypothetical protein